MRETISAATVLDRPSISIVRRLTLTRAEDLKEVVEEEEDEEEDECRTYSSLTFHVAQLLRVDSCHLE